MDNWILCSAGNHHRSSRPRPLFSILAFLTCAEYVRFIHFFLTHPSGRGRGDGGTGGGGGGNAVSTKKEKDAAMPVPSTEANPVGRKGNDETQLTIIRTLLQNQQQTLDQIARHMATMVQLMAVNHQQGQVMAVNHQQGQNVSDIVEEIKKGFLASVYAILERGANCIMLFLRHCYTTLSNSHKGALLKTLG